MRSILYGFLILADVRFIVKKVVEIIVLTARLLVIILNVDKSFFLSQQPIALHKNV